MSNLKNRIWPAELKLNNKSRLKISSQTFMRVIGTSPPRIDLVIRSTFKLTPREIVELGMKRLKENQLVLKESSKSTRK